MSIEFIWQLPTSGDARHADANKTRRGERNDGERAPFTDGVTDPRGKSFNYFDYLHQVARAADLSGFDGIKVQHDLQGDESWIVAGYLARSTRHLKLITEFEAAWGSAVYAAKNAVSFQRFTGGRQAWQISRGADEKTRRQQADPVAAADVTQRIDEFLTVAHGVQNSDAFTFKGNFFEVLNGGFKGPLANHATKSIYLSGHTQEDFELSARQATVHVLDAAPVADLSASIAALQAAAARTGRPLTIGLRVDVLARETLDEALHDAQRYLQQSGRASTTKPLLTDANLWSRFATDRNGAAATLVGSYEQVEQRLTEYADAGIGSFILSAQPSLEEAYRFGEHVLPSLRRRFASNERKAA
jgi:alkanesulfonate monooxygenase